MSAITCTVLALNAAVQMSVRYLGNKYEVMAFVNWSCFVCPVKHTLIIDLYESSCIYYRLE